MFVYVLSFYNYATRNVTNITFVSILFFKSDSYRYILSNNPLKNDRKLRTKSLRIYSKAIYSGCIEAFPLQNPFLPESPSLSPNLLSIKITAGNQFAVKDDF